jgi:hypothetical protein
LLQTVDAVKGKTGKRAIPVETFFSWFTNNDPDFGFDVAEVSWFCIMLCIIIVLQVIKDEIWPNLTQWFTGPAYESDDDEDMGDSDEEGF